MTIFLSPWFWLALATAAAGAATKGWIDEKAAFDSFRGATAALAKEAEGKTEVRIKFDKLNKEKTDADHDTKVAALAATLGELRKSRPAGSFVPAAPAGASRPELLCFDRAEYQQADGEFTAEARGLADEGTASTVDLDAVKEWAQWFRQGQVQEVLVSGTLPNSSR